MSTSTGPIPTAALAHAQGYTVPRAGAPIDVYLDANEKLSVPQESVHALSELTTDDLRRYPSARALEALLADRFGVSADRVLVTNGGDEAIDRACRGYLEPRREVLLARPTFEMIERYAVIEGAATKSVPWRSGAFPTDQILQAAGPNTSMVAIVTPNNPTGAVATWTDVVRISEALPKALVLLDHAYVEFADEDFTCRAMELPNVVVIRTLSKAYGLAGIRVGYALASADIIRVMRAAGGPFTVPVPSAALAASRLAGNLSDVKASIDLVREERAALQKLLSEVGCEALPSQANFLFARTPHNKAISSSSTSVAVWCRDALAGLGIAIRAWPGKLELADAMRITVPADKAVFTRLCASLRAALAPEALLLDMDGVIADVSRSYRDCIIQTAATFGVELTGEDIKAAKAAGDANNDWVLTLDLVRAAGAQATLEQVTQRFQEIYHGTDSEPGLKTTEALLMPRELLEKLSKHIRLGIVTGRPQQEAQEFLRDNNIADLFECVVAMEDTPKPKPDPAPVVEAMQRMNVSSAWMLGDTPDDARAARAAGVVPVGVLAPGDTPCAMTGPLTEAGAARVLSRPAEILNIVELVRTLNSNQMPASV